LHYRYGQVSRGRSCNPDDGAVDLNFYRNIASLAAVGDNGHKHRLRFHRAMLGVQRVAQLTALGVTAAAKTMPSRRLMDDRFQGALSAPSTSVMLAIAAGLFCMPVINADV
jgi:hypothetical protein